MQRIAIVGCSGGGKSTLALAVGARLGLPVVHLDNFYWKPGWIQSDLEEMRPRVDAAAAAERWVIEGNFTAASALRFARADTIIWIELPTWLCLWRAFVRMLLAFGATRPDLAPGCPERFDLEFYGYIWSWNRRIRPRMTLVLGDLSAGAQLIRLRSDKDKAEFLARLPRS